MGKRSDFERRDRDFYETPRQAVAPLLPHLNDQTMFIEPCAGAGALVEHLQSNGHVCIDAFDIEPQIASVRTGDALVPYPGLVNNGECFITNPPWNRKILHPLILNLSGIAPTWLLFDADWAHTKQSSDYMKFCQKIVSIGRVKWTPDSKMTGKDNCAWYLFGSEPVIETIFIGR